MNIVDEAGDPVVGVLCSFAVSDQPGTDAFVTGLSPMTDDNGNATALLYGGTTQGAVQVLAVCGDIIRVAEVAVVSPPASLPDTGMQTPRDNQGGYLLLIELSLAIGVLATLALAVKRSRAAS